MEPGKGPHPRWIRKRFALTIQHPQSRVGARPSATGHRPSGHQAPEHHGADRDGTREGGRFRHRPPGRQQQYLQYAGGHWFGLLCVSRAGPGRPHRQPLRYFLPWALSCMKCSPGASPLKEIPLLAVAPAAHQLGAPAAQRSCARHSQDAGSHCDEGHGASAGRPLPQRHGYDAGIWRISGMIPITRSMWPQFTR